MFGVTTMKNNIKQITEWEVMTPEGWSNFSGVKRLQKKGYYKISFSNDTTLKCSPNHKIKLINNVFQSAESVQLGDKIQTDKKETTDIIKKEFFDDEIELFDLMDVEKNNEYYANGVVNHNCAHIEDLRELWKGLFSTVSTGGRIILSSTPKGKGNLFHDLWIGAEGKKNGFNRIFLPWTVHPERGPEWFDEQCRALDASGVAQELLASFESSAKTFFAADTIDRLRSEVVVPVFKRGFRSLEGSDVWFWKPPQEDHKYLVVGDPARGDGDDSSAFFVIDTTSDEVVVEGVGKSPPDKFADVLIKIGAEYNKAWVVQEKNSIGLATAIRLKDSKYPRLYYQDLPMDETYYISEEEKEERYPGFTTTQKNRDEMLNSLEEVLRNKRIKIYSSRFIEELETFIWTGKRGQALKGKHDDLIMSLAIGCYIHKPQGRFDPSEAGNSVPAGSMNDWSKAFLAGCQRTSRVFNNAPLNYGMTAPEGSSFSARDPRQEYLRTLQQNHSPEIQELFKMFRWIID